MVAPQRRQVLDRPLAAAWRFFTVRRHALLSLFSSVNAPSSPGRSVTVPSRPTRSGGSREEPDVSRQKGGYHPTGWQHRPVSNQQKAIHNGDNSAK